MFPTSQMVATDWTGWVGNYNYYYYEYYYEYYY